MKRVLFQTALCAVVLCGSCVKAEECAPRNKTQDFNVKFEQIFRGQKKAKNAKTSYKNLVDRVMATVDDKDVIAARAELYKATKKVVAVVQKKFVMTPEEIAQVQRLGEVLAKQKNGQQELTEEEEVLVQAFQLLVLELAQEYPAEKLKRMADREVALFNKN